MRAWVVMRSALASPSARRSLVTAFGSVQNAVGALRAGAYDFISKPIQFPELLLTLDRALQHRPCGCKGGGEFGTGQRLLEIVPRTQLHRLNCRIRRPVSRVVT